ncbi:putative phospholipase B-like 2 [Panonychus citri]|uniref:putative phospholipase B-like 2 n=1 Tax=Panonychus citri TaxID=50023 RepID=UPI0023072672|nr:putative phospholipase B-like 2 [Panonychus citri]
MIQLMSLLITLLIVGINCDVKCIRIIEYNWISIENVTISNIPLGLYPICASFYNQINQTGWSFLTIWSDPSTQVNDSLIAYLAGYLEGYMTVDLIVNHYDNAWNSYCSDDPKFCKKIFKFYQKKLFQIKSNLDAFSSNNSYWYQVSLILNQLTGLSDGITGKTIYKPGINIDLHGKIFILNILTDIMSMESVYNRTVIKSDLGHTSCSALVKLTVNELIVGHATWYELGCMLRIIKKYNLPYRTGFNDNSTIPGSIISMTSYPGLIFSCDDYYLISSGLVVMETSLTNYNSSNNKLIEKNEGLLTFIRTMVANRLASDGHSWSSTFGQYNSGAYNNQFMIIDYNKFDNVSYKHQAGLLWVLEQMPGLIVAKDMTKRLIKKRYWSSYNIPYFQEIYQLANYQSMRKLHGSFADYNTNPRARQFKRKQSQVYDYKSGLKLLRYNNYLKDPDARCNCDPPYSSGISIASRSDLNNPNGRYDFLGGGLVNEAAIDAKVTSYKLFKQLKMYAISGPTYQDVPPFIWSNSTLRDTVSHKGHPDVWVFEPIYF